MDFKELNNFIINAVSGQETKDSIVGVKEDCEDTLETIKNEIARIEQECWDKKEYMELIMAKSIEDLPDDLKEVGKTRERLIENQETLEKAIDDLKGVLENYRNFNKQLCFARIREMIKNSDVKIGQIEKEAGVRLGYMARLEKDGNKAEPTVEFLVSAAKLLDVSMDFLVNTGAEIMTESEEFFADFVQKLISDTKKSRLSWHRISAEKMSEEYDMYSSYGQVPPLFLGDCRTLDEGGDPITYRFGSHFYPEKEIRVTSNSYWTELQEVNSEIYIVPIKMKEKNVVEEFFEVYLVNDEKTVPLCCTKEVVSYIARIVNNLYHEAEGASSRVQIDSSTKSIISMYMKGEKIIQSKQLSLIDDEDTPF